MKKDGSLRICGNYKVTLNPHLMIEKYPLRRIEKISKLHGREEFTKLDLSMAYQQIELDEESRKFTTISTSKGLFELRVYFAPSNIPENNGLVSGWSGKHDCIFG